MNLRDGRRQTIGVSWIVERGTAQRDREGPGRRLSERRRENTGE